MPKREKARILAAMQQSTQNRGQQRALATELDDQPRLLAAVLRAHMETCEFTREKVSAMRRRARDCPSYSMPTLVSIGRDWTTTEAIRTLYHRDDDSGRASPRLRARLGSDHRIENRRL